jgi:hypothetical protein
MPRITTPGTIQLHLTLDEPAYQVLRQLTPSKKTLGRTLNRLLYAEQARQEERDRLEQRLAPVGKGDEA